METKPILEDDEKKRKDEITLLDLLVEILKGREQKQKTKLLDAGT